MNSCFLCPKLAYRVIVWLQVRQDLFQNTGLRCRAHPYQERLSFEGWIVDFSIFLEVEILDMYRCLVSDITISQGIAPCYSRSWGGLSGACRHWKQQRRRRRHGQPLHLSLVRRLLISEYTSTEVRLNTASENILFFERKKESPPASSPSSPCSSPASTSQMTWGHSS